MRKVALVFVLAVFGPSLILAWLALRSVKDQEIVAERQQTLLYQGVCSGLAKDLLGFIADRQSDFGRHVETLLTDHRAQEVAAVFDERILRSWPLAEVGFAVSLEGRVLSPPLLARPETRRFRLEHDLFLSNQESVEVYWNSPKGIIPLSKSDENHGTVETSQLMAAGKEPGGKGSEKFRAVSPQKNLESDGKHVSRSVSSEAEFRQLIGDGTEGVIGRFLQNRLKLLLWYRSPQQPDIVFGAQLNLPALIAELSGMVKVDNLLQNEICVALLDDTGRPTARSLASFVADWKRPFVSVEIGEVLPHWEVAAYLLNPNRPSRTKRTLALTLGLLVALLITAIGIGGWLIVADVRRELSLARQKTDFVSTVSHELKSPLTSIRMFSELLAGSRIVDERKRRTYLNIISTEVARLTRLINNVLDYARLERGEKHYQFRNCDLNRVVRETVESYRPHLEGSGFRLNCRLDASPSVISGDPDAMAQIVVNLLSNAEKYSGDGREIGVETRVEAHPNPIVELRVLDRGLGVPAGCEEKIFEQFFRAHDSLNSGIQGSGLGLTLARQMARAHGGDIAYEGRDGGGSCFVLRLPIESR